MFACAHEVAMGRANAFFIGLPWSSADMFRRTLLWQPLNALEYCEIAQVLFATGGFLGRDQIGQGDEWDREASYFRHVAGGMGAGKIKARNGSQEINAARRQADLKHGPLGGEVLQGHAFDPAAEFHECLTQAQGVFHAWFDPQVDVLREPWLGVMNERIAADDQEPNLAVVQYGEQFFEVGVHDQGVL